MKKDIRQPIQVVDRTLDLLELLAVETVPVPAKMIAEKLGISAQRANNLLRVLYRRGYVSQDQSRRYRLGPQFCLFVNSTQRLEKLRNRLEPFLVDLNRISGFGAFAGVLENDRLYCCAHVLSNGEKASLNQQYWTDELHSTAGGRVLLAALSPEERKKLFARTTRRQMTGKTVMDLEILEQICRDVEKAGFAEVKEESRTGVCSIAIPLRDFSGAVIAQFGLYGSSSLWEETSWEEKLELLKSSRRRLENW